MTHVLCLDDDLDLLRLLRVMLETAGYECSCTTNSEEALQLLHTRAVDLLIQDVRRPDMSGESLCRIIKSDEHLQQIPILIASAYIESGKRLVAEGYADGFVSEPLGPTELLNAVEEVLTKYSIPLPPAAAARMRNRQARSRVMKI